MTSAAATTSAGVWVKLYIGDNDPRPTVFKIEPIPKDVNDLRKEIKQEMELNIAAPLLVVYPKQSEDATALPWINGIEALDPGDTPPSRTTSKLPLLVIARQQQQVS